MKNLSFETFWVSIVATIISVWDIQGGLPWDRWRRHWGLMRLVWGFARIALVLGIPIQSWTPGGPLSSDISLQRLALALAAVFLWHTVLSAAQWDDALRDDRQGWLSPDSLLHIGAAGMLMASWFAHHIRSQTSPSLHRHVFQGYMSCTNLEL